MNSLSQEAIKQDAYTERLKKKHKLKLLKVPARSEKETNNRFVRKDK